MRERLIELIADARNNYYDFSDEMHEKGMPVGESSEEYIADYLLANGVIALPCKVGDEVYCIVAEKGICGGLIYTGHIIKRKVDKLIYDGSRWEMMSERVPPDYRNGNELIYAYFDDLAFVSEEKAEARLEGILDVGRVRNKAEQALKEGVQG